MGSAHNDRNNSGTQADNGSRRAGRRVPYAPPPAIPQVLEILICVFAIGALGVVCYGTIMLAQRRNTEAIYGIGGGMFLLLVLFALTHRAVKARRKRVGTPPPPPPGPQ